MNTQSDTLSDWVRQNQPQLPELPSLTPGQQQQIVMQTTAPVEMVMMIYIWGTMFVVAL
jgi:hypothetical protein